MSAKHSFSPLRCCGAVFLVLTVLLACLFLLQATDVYFGALDAREEVRAQVAAQAQLEGWSERVTAVKTAIAVSEIPIYSRQIVGARLQKLLPYVCVWSVSLFAMIAVSILFPAVEAKQKRDPDCMLGQKLRVDRSRLPQEAESGKEAAFSEAFDRYTAVRRQYRTVCLICALLGIACLVFPLLYLLRVERFPGEDITAEVKAAALYCLPFLLILFGGAIAFVFVKRSFLRKERDIVRALRSTGRRVEPAPAHEHKPLRPIVRIALLVIGVGLFVLGTQNGSMNEVLTKAINICTECIGLG